MHQDLLLKEETSTVADIPADFNDSDLGCRQPSFTVHPTNSRELEESKAICRGGCPMQRRCLQIGVATEETGVWGGFYINNGEIRHGNSFLQGKTGVRTQTVDQMFAPDEEGDRRRRRRRKEDLSWGEYPPGELDDSVDDDTDLPGR